MLQPGGILFIALVLLITVDQLRGQDYIKHAPRKRSQDEKDVATVLLVDSQGRSSFGRFLSVKPDLGLITSTARTFIQEGVTTEYATQVLGTTLDNGRLYAQLLTKSSRVLYDDSPSKAHEQPMKKWNLDENIINVKQFIKNTDYISPNRAEDAFYVFPTVSPIVDIGNSQDRSTESIEEELLKESPTNNLRVSLDENLKNKLLNPLQNNVKVYKISPQVRDMTQENVINHKESNEAPVQNSFSPSKVKQWENLPTFTVRNEFSPSGFSFLGDFPDFEVRTERSKPTTPSERKARLLFKAGLAKPNPKDFKSITYTGFADFTTTVGDTIIVFTPHSSEVANEKYQIPFTSSPVKPSLIQPTTTLLEPPIATKVSTFLSQEPPMETKTWQGHKLEMKTLLPTMVIDKTDRAREPKSQVVEEQEDLAAKMSVLAHEQGKETTSTFTPELIQPSESQPIMLSTPSDEDIAKILASLQAQHKQSTQPLSSGSTIIFDSPKEQTKDSISGASTIFFDDDVFDFPSPVVSPPESTVVAEIGTTTPKEPEVEVTTENVPESTTTLKPDHSSFLNEILTTLEEELSTVPIQETTPALNVADKEDTKEVDTTEKAVETSCIQGHQVVPTTVYKTLTYLTTFFIPSEEKTSTSINSNEVVSKEIRFETRKCDDISPSIAETTIQPSAKTTTEQLQETTTEPVTEEIITVRQEITTLKLQDANRDDATTTEIEPATTETSTEETEDDEEDEVELIFKTLYTTYTYLTTYFQESTSSVASRIVVTTNVITSTLDPGNDATDDAVAGFFEHQDNVASKTVSFEDLADITPSRAQTMQATATASTTSGDDAYESDDDDEESVISKPTPILNDHTVLNGVKTYYTTYTYFTTIFVDGETEISSRTEVYTNYVTPSMTNEATSTKIISGPDEELDDDEKEIKEKILKLNINPDSSYNTIQRSKTSDLESKSVVASTPSSKEQSYVTLQRNGTTTESNEIESNGILDLSGYETIATMVTDVRSSTSQGDRRIIDNLDKRNVLLEDQVVSESNNDSEIIPSPTLLLQTSYTTFTYFTTMYHGTTSSNIVSRLDTVTNVVTQTLSPTQTMNPDDTSLPVTYFTTFTYWTTLYKDGTTKVTSREETVSNIETPTIEPTSLTASTKFVVAATPTVESSLEPSSTTTTIVPSTVGEDDLTTYFTTYTYYTTSYIGDETVLNSRLETVTNVLKHPIDISANQIGKAVESNKENKIETDKPQVAPELKQTGLLSTIVNTVENNGTSTVLSTDVYGTYINGLYAKVLESTTKVLTPTITPSPVATQAIKPTGVVSINEGKIVDAEGVSTLFYTTQAIGTYIDDSYAQVTQSTSSLTVDVEKKSLLPTELPVAHRTGLVRLIEGSIKQNDTTTFYKSKVLGTVIDGRYAQIIESTSSFLIGSQASIKPSGVATGVVSSATQAPGQAVTDGTTISPTPAVIEGSIRDTAKTDEDSLAEDEEEEIDDNGRVKSRLTFQSKKRTFTPAIRPFAARQRPTFAPKRKPSGQSTAATITRSDFTPTVTAVPASKSNRFGGRRSSSSGTNVIQPTASGRRFSRPKSTSSSGSSRRSSSRVQPTSSGFGASSRRSGFRSSSIRPTSLFGARSRVRPTASRNPATQTPPDEENDLTTVVTDEPTDTAGEEGETTLSLQPTESTPRRNQNPLLRFKRPPVARRPPTARNRSTTRRTTTTSTTSRPKTTPGRPSSLLNRQRPNGLFPRRNLFTTTTPVPEEEPEEEEDVDDLDEEKEDDTDYDSSLRNTQTAKPPTTPQPKKNVPQIKPFFRKRSKRDTYSRFRRPSSRTTSTSTTTETISEEVTEPPRFNSRSRFVPKTRGIKTTQPPTTAASNNSRKRISPSKTTQSRQQFTLREKDKRTSLKRPSSNSRTFGTSTAPSRNKPLRGRSGHQTEPSTNRKSTTTASRRRSSGRARTNQRNNRYQNTEIENDNYVLPTFDGTITVTHHIPTEVTIPVVNNGVTDYKSVITASYSTEVLDPRQYSTSVNAFGKDVKVLVSENTGIGNNGAKVITQFVLNEKPTTSVVFTPTYINRRKTSFSHVIPSTVYEVESVVNTIQPALAAQAPLANILLSQLLLGGLQPQPNALLGIQQPALVNPTPTTELKTKTTTYVTTVTSRTSTVLPLTFRGKEILTTIIDSSVSVFTATEFLTETVTVTPQVGYPVAPQLNTALLLQLQQLQQQQTPSPLAPQSPANVYNLQDQPVAEALYSDEETENFALEEPLDLQETEPTTSAPRRKTGRKGKKHKQVEAPKETSIITLYVSGRTPGEFTTVLSTVTIGEESNRKKRGVDTPVRPSRLSPEMSFTDQFDSYIMPANKDVELESSEETRETQSLESILGDVSKHYTTRSELKPSKYKKYRTKYVRAASEKSSAQNFLV